MRGSRRSSDAPPSAPSSAGDPAASANLAAALQVVPSAATGFTFVDHAAMKARWGVPDLDSSVDLDGDEWQQYMQHARTAPLGNLATYLIPMISDWGWSGLDVVWEINPTVDGPPTTVYRMRDGLDMQAVIDSLTEQGYQRVGSDQPARYRVDLADATGGVPFFAATVLPEQHLLITGHEPDAVLSAMADPGASLADSAAVERLLAGVAPEYALVTLGAGTCSTLLDQLGSQTSPEELKQQSKQRAELTDGWHPIAGWAVLIVDDHDAAVTVDLLTDDAAAADLDARAAVLREGTSARTGAPLAELYTVTDAQAVGPVLRFDLTVAGPASRIASMAQVRDTPWALCPTSG